MRVAIVGAGVTGLTAAYRLLDGDRALEVTVIERSARTGGSLVTVERDGFVFDGGADAFVAAKPEALALCKDLGLEDRVQTTRPEFRSVYFLKNGAFVKLPEGLVLAVPTRFWPLVSSPLFSLGGVARMGLDLVLPRRRTSADESIASFLGRRLGSEAVEILGEPLLGGIYSGDPQRLSIAATFPQLTALEKKHRSLIVGALASRAASVAKSETRAPGTASPFRALRGGMGELARTLEVAVRQRGADLRMETDLAEVERAGSAFRLTLAPKGRERTTIETDRVLFACGAGATSRALERIDADVARELRAIPHVSTAALLLAYDRADVPHPLDASGVLIPRKEGRDASALTFMSSKWEGRAPEGSALIRVFLGGHARPEIRGMTDGDVLHVAREELRAVLGITAEPSTYEIFRWQDCRPQPVLGHEARVQRIRDGLRRSAPGIHVAGGAFDGVGISDCIRQANSAAIALGE